ncbi:bifunctional transcriptional activator/DNA repair enzyme AdaA [Pseudomonas sp. MWU13-2100]|uniref:bifunctional transcriptional activator/DNA repair enzyme AdaA n=1 Tax=Pseudomonas sp. MWU13-2100 TaxID=2935075 RepID=UPI00200C0383|nr:methylated-DNA--[protein]-cysteine S-methyltransferase [Pseudomonas sp. MWU13-2100]
MNTSSQGKPVEKDPRWQAVLARDASADRDFVYGVRTTGVYCRPSSGARRPNPENVEFFDTPEQAEAAGYRPSRRAAADQTSSNEQHVALVTRACQLIETSDTPPSLNPLAEQLGLSPFHFHRVFKAVTGLTPKAYAIGLDLPLDLRGTAFQERVWQALRNIPVGSTASYADIARMIGAPKSFRAVAQACGANSLAVAIPCHRVVRSDGNLSGYRWGVERKRQLLDREAQ